MMNNFRQGLLGGAPQTADMFQQWLMQAMQRPQMAPPQPVGMGPRGFGPGMAAGGMPGGLLANNGAGMSRNAFGRWMPPALATKPLVDPQAEQRQRDAIDEMHRQNGTGRYYQG